MEILLAALVAGTGAMLGVTAGFGGAVLIVPLLLLVGYGPPAAATAGLISVVTAAAAAAPRQVGTRLANLRLGVTIELAASVGVVAGTVLLPLLTEVVFRTVLAVAILVAAIGSFLPRPMRNLPDAGLGPEALGEEPGTLAGAYPLAGQVVPYRAVRVRAGMLLAIGVGLVAGLTGTSGGYLKMPVMSEIMHVPIKVAAATTTFISGLTGVAGLAVLLPAGHLEAQATVAVITGAAVGGALGARVQAVLAPAATRRGLAVVLFVIVGAIAWTT